jgi:hypothetical protein
MSRRLIVLLAVVAMLFVLAPLAGASSDNENFRARLSGSNEVPANDSDAFGKALVRLRDGDLSFKLVVNNIELDVSLDQTQPRTKAEPHTLS